MSHEKFLDEIENDIGDVINIFADTEDYHGGRLIPVMDKIEAYFEANSIPISPYPSDLIPSGAELIIAVDPAKEGSECTVKAFSKDGVIHVQEVTWSGARDQTDEVKK